MVKFAVQVLPCGTAMPDRPRDVDGADRPYAGNTGNRPQLRLTNPAPDAII